MNIKKLVPQKVKDFKNDWTDSFLWLILNNVISSFPSQTIRIWFLRRMGADIAKGVPVYGGSEFRGLPNLVIGQGSSIGHRALLDARKGLHIGKNVTLATEVMIWSLHHDYNDPEFTSVGGPVIINDYAWLGSRCIILPNITIGEGAIVSAGALVSRDVLPYTVVGGVPAKVIAKRTHQKYNYNPAAGRMHMV